MGHSLPALVAHFEGDAQRLLVVDLSLIVATLLHGEDPQAGPYRHLGLQVAGLAGQGERSFVARARRIDEKRTVRDIERFAGELRGCR